MSRPSHPSTGVACTHGRISRSLSPAPSRIRKKSGSQIGRSLCEDSRRQFVTIGLGVAALKTTSALTRTPIPQRAAADELLSLSLSEVSKRIRSKQVTSVELTRLCWTESRSCYLLPVQIRTFGRNAKLAAAGRIHPHISWVSPRFDCNRRFILYVRPLPSFSAESRNVAPTGTLFNGRQIL